MSWKDKALDLVAEKDKQSTDLHSFQRANEDLKAQLRDFDERVKESESRCLVAEKKVSYYESTEYTAKVVDIYISSPKHEEELFKQSNSFYDKGCAHIL